MKHEPTIHSSGSARLVRFGVGIYALGVLFSGAYFNWTFIKNNGWVPWLLIGETTCTAKAAIWPYYTVSSPLFATEGWAIDRSQGMPQSVQMFLSAIDALLEADERPAGIASEANLRRVEPILRRAVDAGQKANREELNSIHPGLGDHFLDDAIAHARFMVRAIDAKDDDAATRAAAAIVRWQKWWGAHRRQVMATIADRYSRDE
jgi:hypothetical protein